MIRAGLTGGFACGKSYVAQVLESLGCHVIRADELGHLVLAPDGEAYGPVIQHFGRSILDPTGRIDRKKLAGEVFGHPGQLEVLNSIVHPAVFRLEEEFMDNVQRTDLESIAVVEAAILIETGSYRRFDCLIVVVCTEDQQIARALSRDGSTREQAEARLKRQMPLSEKRKYADYIIDSSGSLEHTAEQTRRVYEALKVRNTQ